MRFSKTFIATLRETPAGAEAISHILMLRGGFIRQLAAGLYIYLPLGWRVIERINRIIREEMNAIGAQEIAMPALHPADIWQKTGRWFDIGDEMFRLKDRCNREMCLGMTHEEIITWLASMEIRSYRELPQIWYQIQTKFRDEARPKSGVLRTREFLMKDSYSFDRDEKGLEESYQKHAEAYHRIFRRCGIRFYQVQSDPGIMGGGCAHEFMAPSPSGEDTIALCGRCGYSANIEIASSIPQPQEKTHDEWILEDIPTPDRRTVEEVSSFLDIDPHYFIKSLLLIGEDGPFLALVRGDQELHEKKLQRIVGKFRQADRDEVRGILGVEAGFIGPHNNPLKKIADTSLKEGVYISGANKEGFHTKGIMPFRDFDAEWHDIHVIKEEDRCPVCKGDIRLEKAIEIGNIFKLGTRYSIPLKAFYLDEDGKGMPLVMGSYGIGPARIAASAIEQNHDEHGIIWPEAIAPFNVHIIPLSMDDMDVVKVADRLYSTLCSSGVDAIIDDRDVRAGVKFNDADMIGIPYQIIIGKKTLKEGLIELKSRRTGIVERLSPSHVVERFTRFSSKE